MGDADRLTELRSSGTSDQKDFWSSFRFGVGLAAVFLSTVVVTLSVLAVAAAVVPRWHSTVVASESMLPALRRGDTVVYDERTIDEVGPDTVVVFEDEDRNLSIIHRVVTVNDDGTLTTRGDANPSNDSSPVTADEIRGAGRIVVPWVGLVRLWWLDGRHLLVISIIVGVMMSLHACRLLSDPEIVDRRHDDRTLSGGWLGSTAPAAPSVDPAVKPAVNPADKRTDTLDDDDPPAGLVAPHRRRELLTTN